ncbi:MAG: carboxymuconolactone decarboxylase family protein [Comamonadaceae bacterium]|nr:MAG: carboxymuconolactone decarboxylase family protein [Comamonadaceae bacterium]
MRIVPVTPGTVPALAEQEARILAERGRISPLYQVLLNSPPLAHGWEQLLSAVRNRNSVPADVRELVILRVAVLNGASYEFDAHVPPAQAAGLGPAAIEAVRLVPLPEGAALTGAQQVAVRLADAMTRDIVVPDALDAQVRKHFPSAQQHLDLVATVAAYNMVSRLLVALHIGH